MTNKEKKAVREAVANYMWSEGCGCCQQTDKHRKHKMVLAKLLGVPKYKDGSGFDFYRFKTKAKT